jgi:hypothetical protein
MTRASANPAGSGNGDGGARQGFSFGQNKPATNRPAATRDASRPRVTSYVARHIKRRRATKAEVEERREKLFDIIEAMRPMTVRQVFYQATVCGIVEKTEAGYTKVQTDLVLMRKAGDLPYEWLADNTRWQHKPNTFANIEDALKETAASYRKALSSRSACAIWCRPRSRDTCRPSGLRPSKRPRRASEKLSAS